MEAEITSALASVTVHSLTPSLSKEGRGLGNPQSAEMEEAKDVAHTESTKLLAHSALISHDERSKLTVISLPVVRR